MRHGRLHRRGGVVLSVLRVLLVRMLWLRGLWGLCGVGSIIHRLVAPSHLSRLLLLLLSSIRLAVPRGMVSKRVRRRRLVLLLLLLLLLQRLLVLQRWH
jgi:hypothetical protein